MDLLAIVLLGFVIGAVLGGLGGGGAILTVPVLVYIVGQSGQDATTSSLVIVGLTAGVGVLSYLEAKGVRWGLGLTFGLVGFPATFAGSYLNHRVDENILLLGFSGLMVIAAVAMFGTRSSSTAGDTTPDSRSSAEPADPHGHQGRLGSATPSARTSVLEARATRTVAATRLSPVNIVAVALGVGLLTGFFGVGGGFVVRCLDGLVHWGYRRGLVRYRGRVLRRAPCLFVVLEPLKKDNTKALVIQLPTLELLLQLCDGHLADARERSSFLECGGTARIFRFGLFPLPGRHGAVLRQEGVRCAHAPCLLTLGGRSSCHGNPC